MVLIAYSKVEDLNQEDGNCSDGRETVWNLRISVKLPKKAWVPGYS
jgi:hypothetical protein